LNYSSKTSQKFERPFLHHQWAWLKENIYGLLFIIGISFLARQLAQLELLNGALSAAVIALLIGIVFVNTGFTGTWIKPSLDFSSRQLLKIGISLLGFRLAFSEISKIGSLAGILIIICVVAISFSLIIWIGKKISVSQPLTLLVAAGFPICGISAITAVKPLSGADDKETGYAVGLVTIFGSISILLFSILQPVFDFEMNTLGWWIGLSVHDTSQVVAAASTAGESALDTAVVVKICRILLLAPMLLLISLNSKKTITKDQRKTFPIPIFILGFIAAAALSSTEVLTDGFLDTIGEIRNFLITAAMFGLGAGIRLNSIKGLGIKPLLLGSLSWVTLLVLAGFGTLIEIQFD